MDKTISPAYGPSGKLAGVTIGQRIAERLRSLEISQAELARRVGIDQSTINALINDRSHGSKHLHRIARELRTTVEFLERETGDSEIAAPPFDLDSNEREMIARMRVLDPRDRKAILRLVESLAGVGGSQTLQAPRLEYRTE